MGQIKTRRVKIPIYHGTLVVHVFSNDEERKVLELKYSIDESQAYSGMFFPRHDKLGFTRYIICLSSNCNYRDIVHECVHFMNAVFSDRGITLDPYNDEPQAYFMGWAFKQCELIFDKK